MHSVKVHILNDSYTIILATCLSTPNLDLKYVCLESWYNEVLFESLLCMSLDQSINCLHLWPWQTFSRIFYGYVSEFDLEIIFFL